MAGGSFGGGTGSVNDPYLVEDAQDLDAVRNDLEAYYRQVQNIDLSMYGNFTTIGSWYGGSPLFFGVYDGDNYIIEGLTQVGHLPPPFTHEERGLFGATGAGVLENIRLSNVTINAEVDAVGALVGTVMATTIKNVRIDGVYVEAEALVGGLAGHCYGANIELVSVTNAEITANGGYGIFGGLTGWAGLLAGGGPTFIKNCYVRGDLKQAGDIDVFPPEVAGFANWLEHGGIIENCYSACTLISTGDKYGFAGYVLEDSEVRNCYYDGTLAGYVSEPEVDTEGGSAGEPRSTELMKTQSTFVGWDFDNVWAIHENYNDGYPFFLDWKEEKVRVSFRHKGGEVRVSVRSVEDQNLLWLYDNSVDEGTGDEVLWKEGETLIYGARSTWMHPTPPNLPSRRNPIQPVAQSFRTFYVLVEEGLGPIELKFECTDEANPCRIDAVQVEPDFSGKWPSVYTPGRNSEPLITTVGLEDGSITTDKFADQAVTKEKISKGALTSKRFNWKTHLIW